MSIQIVSSDLLIQLSGKGRIILKDGRDYAANFQIYQLDPGNVVGSLSYKIDCGLNDILNPNETFRFDGETGKGLVKNK